jgi:cysteine-rich repeat protein
MRWWLCCVLAACIDSSSVVCKDGTVCPSGTSCAVLTNPDETACVVQAQLDACAGKPDHMACTTAAISTGRCYDGTCMPVVCGNGRIDIADPAVPGDVGEVCDDHNNVSGDGCSADCKSDETCGNGVRDGVSFEQCDDGNLVDHDGCDSRCVVEEPHWHSLGLDAIPAHANAGMVYEADRQRIVLFGTSPANTSDTWLWDGAGWRDATPLEGPSPRTDPAMVYDAAHHRVVLFGGRNVLELDDTWQWDGMRWTRIATPIAPKPRRAAAIVFDAHRKRVVMFGGSAQVGLNDTSLDEMWELDGTTWTQITTTLPPKRSSAAMAYDPVRGRIVMFGGVDAFMPKADTWEYDGVKWTQKAPASAPSARYGASLAWDPVSHDMVLFGGDTGTATGLDETWTWDGTTWTQHVLATRPAPRYYGQLATDAARGRIVLFGGTPLESPPKTWQWTGTAWIDVTPSAPRGQAGYGIAVDTDRGRSVLVDALGATWETDGTSWQTFATGPAPVRSAYAMAYDGARRSTLLFGGFSGSVPQADTWRWDAATWTKLAPSMAPTARSSTMAYDGAHQQIVMFGGTSDSTNQTFLDETWLWDGTTWTQAQPAHRPPARNSGAIAYDPIRRQVVLFGGTIGTTFLADTWIWDGSDWLEQHPMHSPRSELGTLVWAASRRRLTLITGVDAWEWDGSDWSFIAAGSSPPPRQQAALFPARGGAGVVVFSGIGPSSGPPPKLTDSWLLRWESLDPDESCRTGDDLDGDMLAACADPDCWYACTPECPPGTSCDPAAPHCGDGTCNALLEDCQICPQDCTCAPVCGDFVCDPTETAASCPGDCP